jgi:hypothetical protein
MFRESTKQGNGKVARQMPQWKALVVPCRTPVQWKECVH